MMALWVVSLVFVVESRLWRVRSLVHLRQAVGGRNLTNALLGALAFNVQATALWGWAWLQGSRGQAWLPHGLNLSDQAWAAQWAFNLLGMSFVGYWMHRLMHAWAPLWLLHRVHHADGELSPSVAYRHHALEALIQVVPTVLWQVAFHVDASVLQGTALCLLANSLLQHSAVRWPPRVEQGWSWLIPTPACHWVHHEQGFEASNRNFSEHCPLWDSLFGTYMAPRPAGQSGLVYGVPGMTGLNAVELTESFVKRY
ncbi:MAG: hypothetical protein RI907_3194 [Pseudomonadota bacterium]|jgi:sterol desaturase/sphingolipid hydroxylase (fatty acid hydroxylase superfamily)